MKLKMVNKIIDKKTKMLKINFISEKESIKRIIKYAKYDMENMPQIIPYNFMRLLSLLNKSICLFIKEVLIISEIFCFSAKVSTPSSFSKIALIFVVSTVDMVIPQKIFTLQKTFISIFIYIFYLGANGENNGPARFSASHVDFFVGCF